MLIDLSLSLSLSLSARLIASERLISLECGVDLVFGLTPPPPPVGSWLCVVQLFTGCVVLFFGIELTNTSDLELRVCVCVCTQCSPPIHFHHYRFRMTTVIGMRWSCLDDLEYGQQG